ncbi:MAG: hypothetical protein SH821_00015 [Phototrophicales bacterium]|nr:hypothetical protein [Phototrophicales bacterium]
MPTPTPFAIRFTEYDKTASAIRAPLSITPTDAVAALNIPPVNGILTFHGGGSGMEQPLISKLEQFFYEGLMPFAESHRLMMVFGGTRAGAMEALGNAYHHAKATTPLIGVCPFGAITYPKHPFSKSNLIGRAIARLLGVDPNQERYSLQPYYTHFVLLESGVFGDESPIIVNMSKLAKHHLAIVVNGGEITQKEVLEQIKQKRIILTIKGSGRYADELADPKSETRTALPSDARIVAIDIEEPQLLIGFLRAFFQPLGS